VYFPKIKKTFAVSSLVSNLLAFCRTLY
jgi:hypothetical protein